MSSEQLMQELLNVRAELVVMRDAVALLLADLSNVTGYPLQKMHSTAMDGLNEAGELLSKTQSASQSDVIGFSVEAAVTAADALYSHAQTQRDYVQTFRRT